MIVSDELKQCEGKMDHLCKKLIETCQVSRDNRRTQARSWRSLYHTGSTDGQTRRVNKTRNYIEKLSSLLYSPSDVRFEITFDEDEAQEWEGAADLASRHVNRNFRARKCNIAFGQALEIGLIEMSAFIKLNWGHAGLAPSIIRQQFMGVGREDLNDLSDQEVITHTFFQTPDQFRRMLGEHRDKQEILNRVRTSFTEKGNEESGLADVIPGSYLHEIIVGGTVPVGSGTASGSRGNVGVFGPPLPMLSPQVSSKLIEVTDIWIMNDTANNGEGGWATIRYCEPGIVIEGEYMLRNLGDIPHELPFLKVSPNEIPGYMWGLSELEAVYSQQEWFAARVQNVDDIFALRARPPRSFEGFSGLTPEKMRALLTRGGTFTSDAVAGQTRITSHAPDMPQEALELLKFIDAEFDEAGGMTNVLSGEGEQGVRAGSHAQTLLRTSTPRLRDKATLVESQLTDFGELALTLLQAKDARQFHAGENREFMLSQLPEDAMIAVDAHSSSPAFSGDTLQLAFALFRAQAIDGEDLLNMTQPPHLEELVMKFRKREKARQALIAQHPELLAKGLGGGRQPKK